MGLLLASLLVLVLAGCDPGIPERPGGIVSLAPAITETIIALDRTELLVAVSDYESDPAVAGLPRVGTAITPNFEAIARLRPALVYVDHSGEGHRSDLARLARTVGLPWLTLEEVALGIEAIGREVKAAAAGAALAERIRSELDVASPANAPRVLLVLDGPDLAQTWFIRSNSLHGRALHAAGARNAVPDPVDGPAVLAPEALLAAAPDTIIVLTGRGEPSEVAAAAARRFAPLQRLPAVAAGRIGAVTGEAYLLPGPGILALVKPLRDEIERLGR